MGWFWFFVIFLFIPVCISLFLKNPWVFLFYFVVVFPYNTVMASLFSQAVVSFIVLFYVFYLESPSFLEALYLFVRGLPIACKRHFIPAKFTSPVRTSYLVLFERSVFRLPATNLFLSKRFSKVTASFTSPVRASYLVLFERFLVGFITLLLMLFFHRVGLYLFFVVLVIYGIWKFFDFFPLANSFKGLRGVVPLVFIDLGSPSTYWSLPWFVSVFKFLSLPLLFFVYLGKDRHISLYFWLFVGCCFLGIWNYRVLLTGSLFLCVCCALGFDKYGKKSFFEFVLLLFCFLCQLFL